MKKIFRISVVIACLLIMTLAVVGCKPAEEDKMVIGFLSGIYEIQWEQDMEKELKKFAEEEDATIITMDSHLDPAEQLQQLDTMISQGVDGIIIFVANQKISQTVVDKCLEAGIPIVGESNRLIDEEGNICAPCVELDGYGMGVICAEWLVQYMEDNGISAPYEGVGFMNLHEADVSNIVDRADGAEETFFSLLPDFPKDNYFRVETGKEGGAAAGFNIAQATISGNPQIKKWVVIAPQDDQGGGVVRALEQAGLADDSVVVSMGAESARYEWADKGSDTCWKAASFFSAYDCAVHAWRGLMEQVKEGKALEDVFADSKEPGQKYGLVKFTGQMVTPDNFREIMGEYAE